MAVEGMDAPRGHLEADSARGPTELTLVALYENREQGEAARTDVASRGYDPEPLLLPRRGDGPEQGESPTTGAGTTRAESRSADPEAPAEDDLGGGTTLGATIGGTMGLLATTYLVPGVGAALPGVAPLVSTVAGAGLGALLGAGLDYGTRDDAGAAHSGRLSAGQVRLAGALLVCRVKEQHAEAVQRLLQRYGPLELRVQ